MEYTFDTHDKSYTTYLVNKYKLPCDSKGYIMWNEKYGNIPLDTCEYVMYIANLPQNENNNKLEDVVNILQLRHMAATSSLRNLEYSNLNDSVKYNLTVKLNKIITDCERLIDCYKNQMGVARYEAMKRVILTNKKQLVSYFK